MVVETSSSGSNKPIFSNEVWNGDPAGDVTLEFEGCTWKVKKEIVSARFPWIKKALATTTPGSHVIVRPRSSKPTRPKVFSALLQFVHTNELPGHIWEDEPSFYTYVEFYFLAERFGLDNLQLDMVKCVENLARQVPTLTELHCAHCALSREDIEWAEKQHLASFLDAVLVVEEQPWSAKIVKAMYDAGERMKHRLTRLPAFRDFVERFPAGKDFARAIGVHGRAAV